MNLKERARKLKTDIPAVLQALKYKDTPAVALAWLKKIPLYLYWELRK